jgi:isopentenyl diphosphate isomerase/L-lactate dehydrogenase-like FMN-dependent dehydrogenase
MTSPQPAFGDYQLEIYLAGLQGVLPSFPMAFAELEARAAQALPPSVVSYVAGGAGSEHTQRANVTAFRQWGLIPRMLVGAALPALDCLPAVVDAADGLPVLFDSGVRSGADVIKALALGAAAVAVGRPYAYGLALGGIDGIVHVLRSILAEADLIMAVDGYPTRADLTRDSLRRTCTCHHD